MFKANSKKHQSDVNNVALVFLLLTLNIFQIFFIVFLLLNLNKSVLSEHLSGGRSTVPHMGST